MPSLLKIGCLLLFLGICTTNFAQTKRDVLHVKDGSILRGELLALDTIMTKKDTLIEQPIRLQGGTILRYSIEEVIKVESETYNDSLSHFVKTVTYNNSESKLKNENLLFHKKGKLYGTFAISINRKFGSWYTSRNTTISPYLSIGYNILSNLSIGLGTTIERVSYFRIIDDKAEDILIPLFLEAEYRFFNKRIIPYINSKVGFCWILNEAISNHN